MDNHTVSAAGMEMMVRAAVVMFVKALTQKTSFEQEMLWEVEVEAQCWRWVAVHSMTGVTS